MSINKEEVMEDMLNKIDAVKVLKLEKGDNLIIRCNTYIDYETINGLQQMIKEKWNIPEGVKVVVLDKSLDVEVVRPQKREEAETCEQCEFLLKDNDVYRCKLFDNAKLDSIDEKHCKDSM